MRYTPDDEKRNDPGTGQVASAPGRPGVAESPASKRAGSAAWPPPGPLLAAIASTIAEGVQLWDLAGGITYANAATFSQLGMAAADAPGGYGLLRKRMLTVNGSAFGTGCFPVHLALATGQPQLDTLVQVVDADPVRWLRLNAYPCAGDDARAAVISTTVDVTRLVEQERKLEHRAHYDPLTKLPNRALLADRLQQAIARARRNNEMLAVCMLDLDGFKPVNDTLGHDAGDRLLQEIARRLRHCVRSEDTVARFGGDEFAVVVGGFKSLAQCQHVLSRILDLVSVPVTLDKQIAQVSASLGATIFPIDPAAPEQLLIHADEAMYRAKQAGKHRYHLFDIAMESRLKVNRQVLRQMEEGLATGQFQLHYQPVVDCRRGTVIGMEALARWEHPLLGTRLPEEFLPVIEHEEFAIRLGEWAIETALAANREWRDAGFELLLDINVSPLHLLGGDLERLLKRLPERHPREHLRALRFEIVEPQALGTAGSLGPAIERCCAEGVGFVLDAFGSGQSSLPHLIELGAGTLKIGRRQVRELLCDPGDLALVRGIIGLGEAFQRRVVAVGVESIEQVLMLLELGCDVMQGHAILGPMPAGEVLPWLRAFEPDPRWAAAPSGYPARADSDLLMLQVAHRDWFARLRRRLAGAPAGEAPPPQGHAECPLTRWSDASGRRRYRDNPEFEALLALHRQLHAAAEHLPDAGADPQQECAIARLHEELLGRLQAFRVTVAGCEPLASVHQEPSSRPPC